ncbi:MAG: lipopolysaccharide biosynthesis protein RfbH [Verrucomicrobiae bacterium]|nr:lipopolysaccharide biosynthesis protein RfbH [Verrucomicrobiae bacterium]
MSHSPDQLRSQIASLIREYHATAFAPQKFIPGQTPLPVTGKVFDHVEIQHLVEASLDFWLTTGRFAARFERELADFIGTRAALLVNSGSSANLVALSALTSPKLGDRALRPGDEVITVAAGFPTTVNPILQNGLVPVFVDVKLPTYDIDVDRMREALSPKTRAIMIAHTLGNPFDLGAVVDFAQKHHLWLVEDCCDALGATYQGRNIGTFGHIGSVSFYPAHHITMGEGGAVLINDPALKKIAESFRDWGRDCWCEPGRDNTCGRRFGWQFGGLPEGYDHKYTYSHIGYNLKATDMQAAVGVAQLQKLPDFIAARQKNFQHLYNSLSDLSEFLLLPEPTPGAVPSWFGFCLGLRDSAPFSRRELIGFLESRKIATRLLFGGNLTRQPAYQNQPHRICGPLTRTDWVMERVFWIGIYPGLTPEMLDYSSACLHEFIRSKTR